MSVTIVIGGQFGSEGKGKVAHYFTKKLNAKYCVRVGGPNSGHTVIKDGNKYVFRMLPSGIVEDDVTAVLPAGSYIDKDLLFAEMELLRIGWDKVLVDNHAVILSDSNISDEVNSDLRASIGSTASGTGAAVISRIKRYTSHILADYHIGIPTCDTKRVLANACDSDTEVIIEGTQGYGLSLLHSKYYPYVTSRDTSAAAFLSECGLSPFDVKNIVMVIRSLPIRVGGNSGPLPNEMSWKDVTEASGSVEDLIEYTSCTNRVRRVGSFDANVVKDCILCNRPNIIVLNHIDYADYGIHNQERLTHKCQLFIEHVETMIGRKIDYVGTGPNKLVKL